MMRCHPTPLPHHLSTPSLCVSVCEPCPCLWQRQFGSSFDQIFCWFCCVSLSLSVSLSHSLGSFAKLNLTYGKRNGKMFKSCTCKTRNEQQNGRVSTAGITFAFIVQCQLYLTVLKFHFGVCQTGQFGNGNICYFACPARTLKYALNGENGYLGHADGSILLHTMNWYKPSLVWFAIYRQTYINSPVVADQEYIQSMWSATPSFAFYIHFHKVNIPLLDHFQW